MDSPRVMLKTVYHGIQKPYHYVITKTIMSVLCATLSNPWMGTIVKERRDHGTDFTENPVS